MTVRRAALFLAVLLVSAIVAVLAVTGPARSEPADIPEAATLLRTVAARADASGAVQEARMYTRADGADMRHRTDRHPEDDLPLVVAVRYTLDGEPVEPSDLAGAEGEVTARFLIRNLTAERTQISYLTADGEQTEELSVAVPLVGRLIAEFGPGWRDLRSDRGAIAADADGTTLLWTMALFEPFGMLAQELEVTATLEAGTVPAVVLDAAPVTTADSPQLATGRQALAGAQSDAAVLTVGLEGTDAALAQVADSVGTLLAGLAQLRAGAGELTVGLDEAADAAGQLAGGAEEVADGAGQLAGGAAEAAGGSRQLADALDGLADGAGGLARGAGDLADGLDTLGEGTAGLAAGADELKMGTEALADEVNAAAGQLEELLATASAADPGRVSDALAAAGDSLAGLEQTLSGLLPLSGALDDITVTSTEVLDLLTGLQAGADQSERLDLTVAGVAAIRDLAAGARAQVEELAGGLSARVAELATSLTSIGSQLELLGQTGPDSPELLGGINQLRAATQQVAGGAAELAAAAAAVDVAMGTTAAGARQLAGGAGDLAGGTGQAAGGTRELADGIGGLAEGTGTLSAGIAGLAGGSRELATGVTQLAGGSRELASAVSQAVDGVAQLGGGIEQFADEAVGFLHHAADEAAGGVARDLARIDALEARAVDGVPHDVPDGAQANAVYRIRLASAEPFGLPPAGRLIGGLLLLGLAAVFTRRTGQQE